MIGAIILSDGKIDECEDYKEMLFALSKHGEKSMAFYLKKENAIFALRATITEEQEFLCKAKEYFNKRQYCY